MKFKQNITFQIRLVSEFTIIIYTPPLYQNRDITDTKAKYKQSTIPRNNSQYAITKHSFLPSKFQESA